MRVVISPETAVTGEVMDCLRSWSTGGLLDPFCLWRVPVDAESQDARNVVRVDAGVDRTGTLPEVLQDTPSDQITLLGFYATDDAEAFDPRFSERVAECLRHAAHVLAYDKMRPVECAMIVAPGRTGQPVPVEVFCGSWNLYIAPEDRSAPRSPNQLPDSEGFLPRHAAHALATVAELWVDTSAQPSGVLEAVAAEDVFAIDPPAVRVVRCFSRVVDFGYMADHVAAGVFQAGEEWPNPDPDHFDRVGDPGRLLNQAAREFKEIHGEAIGLTEFEPLKLPPEKRPSLFEALKELLGIIMARIRRLPADLADKTLGSAHDRLAERIDKLRGPDLPKTLRWRERPQEDRNLTDIADQLVQPLSIPEGSAGGVWRDLRQLTFALVDGADLPEGMDESSYSRSGKRALVTKPTALVPDPTEKAPGKSVERACDPLSLDPRLVESDESDESEPAAEEEPSPFESWLERRRPTLLWAVGVEIGSALKAARAAAAELEAAAAAGSEKSEEASGEDGEEPVEDADQETSEESAPSKESRWRRLRNALVLQSGLALIASLVLWTQLAPIQAAALQLLVILVWVVGFMSQALRFVRLERSILRAQIEEQLSTANRAMRRALYAGDEPRLERRYSEFLDWAEIIGWMTHQPWVGEPIERVEVVRGAVSRSTLPAAFRVGVAETPERTVDKLCGRARAKVFQAKWLSAQYGSVADDAMARVGVTYSYTGAGGSPDPDADTLDDPDSPRRQLLAAIRRGDGRSLRDNKMTDEVLRFVDRLSLESAADDVRVPFMVGAESDGSLGDDLLNPLPPCAAWFAPPTSLPELTPRILDATIRIAVSSTAGPRVGLGALLTPTGLVVTSLSVVANATGVKATLADGSLRQAAVIKALPEADLALLSLDGGEFPAGQPLALADVEPLLGDPVLTPSPPEGEPDTPDVALGLVTAQYGRQASALGTDFALIGATYRTAAGPAGAPVFDLEGRLAGLHCSTTADGNGNLDAIRTVVDASAVQALLADVERTVAEPVEEPSEDGEDSAVETPSEEGDDSGEEGDDTNEEDAEKAEDPGYDALAVIPGSTLRLATVADAEKAVSRARPGQFLGELFPAVDGPVGLLPQHWVDPDDQHLTETVSKKPDLDGVELGGLSTGAQFMQPLRILVHRVDMTQAVAARELSSCREADGGSTQ